MTSRFLLLALLLSVTGAPALAQVDLVVDPPKVYALSSVDSPGAFQGRGGDLIMLPDTVDFGNVPVGGNYFGKFAYFENATGSPVVINSPYIRGQKGNPFAWFSNLIGQFTIGDGSSLSYGVRFRPPWEGDFEDRLCVPVRDMPDPCVQLRGRGVPALRPEVFQGQTATATTYLPNPGFKMLDVRITADQPWVTPLPSFGLIPVGDSLELTLALNATDLESGTYPATIQVEAVGIYFDYVLPFEMVVGGAVAEEDGAQPDAFAVGDAYPNPTTGAATIPLELDANAMVSVQVYDVRGRHVFSAQETSYSAGRHTLAVEAQRWNAGTYYVRVLVQPEGGVGSVVLRKIALVR